MTPQHHVGETDPGSTNWSELALEHLGTALECLHYAGLSPPQIQEFLRFTGGEIRRGFPTPLASTLAQCAIGPRYPKPQIPDEVCIEEGYRKLTEAIQCFATLSNFKIARILVEKSREIYP